MKKGEENIEENKVREIIGDFFKEIHVNMKDIRNKKILKDSENLDNFVTKNNHNIEAQKIGDFFSKNGTKEVPNKSGIYFVISLNDIKEIKIEENFLCNIEAKGKFKPLSDLKEKFNTVKNNKNAKIIYIGKGDGGTCPHG